MHFTVTIGRGGGPGPALRTGDHCTRTGWWKALERRGPSLFITEGSLMPPSEGQAVIWLRNGVPDCTASCSSDTCPRNTARQICPEQGSNMQGRGQVVPGDSDAP